LRQKGQSEEEIAAAFFVGVNVVKQRLRLAAVSEKLLDIYAEDGMSLDQLMAFTVTNDHARQEQVWEALQRSYSQEPYQIRRMLTERTVRASDRRALFVGIDAYEQAGGIVMRDLFQQDDGGWLENVALLDALVAEKLRPRRRRSPPKDGSGSKSMSISRSAIHTTSVWKRCVPKASPSPIDARSTPIPAPARRPGYSPSPSAGATALSRSTRRSIGSPIRALGSSSTSARVVPPCRSRRRASCSTTARSSAACG
jgi:hypothetical protein